MKKIKAFTLVELLVVILIIGVLATLVILSLNSSVKKAKDARAIDSIRKVQTAIAQIQSESGGAGLTTITALSPYVPASTDISLGTFKSVTGDSFFQTTPMDANNEAIKIHVTSDSTYRIFGKGTSGDCWYISESTNNLTETKANGACS